jgi:hypothetical protein
MIFQPSRFRGFAQRSRDVIVAAALVGIVTGMLVAGFEWLTAHLLDRVTELPLWLLVFMPAVGLALAALALR